MMSDLLLIDRPADGILRLRINRPDKRNAVNQEVREALIDAVTAAQTDADCRALVLGGAEGVFSAGGDLPSMVGITVQAARERMASGADLCRLVANSPFPVVAAAEGFCAGAVVGLSLLGDHIVAGKGTRILFPFLKIGLVPDWGLLYSLPRRVGTATARRLFTRGGPVSGEEAAAMGLVDEYVGEADVMAASVRRAQYLAAFSPRAFTRMKNRLLQPASSLDEALHREETDQAEMMTGPDFAQGYAAFTEKREPEFAPRKGDEQ